ncbi:hypothetical protein LXA43DRAFT_665181 [Ganoderma leucocontextum]|nr:hypothetical protein LXA43DRAFT_665181 [Ganoderma leucocontextum]
MQFLTFFAAAVAASTTFAVAAPTDQGQNQPGQPGWQPTKTDCDKCGDYGHDGGDSGHKDGDHGHDGGDHGHDGGDHGHDGGDHGHGGDDGKWGQKVRVGFSLNLNPNTPLGSLSCSSTFNKKFPQFHTLGDLPTAPFYGEVPGAVDGSPKCGSCWKLQYDGKEPVYMIAVDNAAMFQLGKAGFEKFAGQKGFDKGSVDAKATEVSPEFCHLPPPKW